MAFSDYLTQLAKVTKLVDVLNAAAAELVDPNTPDNKSACISTTSAAFVVFGATVDQADHYGEYFTDFICAAAGGNNATPAVMQDFESLWQNYTNNSPPQMIVDILRDFLTSAESALKSFRQGKSMSG